MPIPDGYTSSAILINYINKVFSDFKYTYRLHEGKQHGVKVDSVPDSATIVIIPDAGSNQHEEHKQLKEKGLDIIILDHHEADKESEYAIVVNNQLSPEYDNKALSGAGIVYRFLQALDEELGVDCADSFLDLVAIGNVADMMSLESPETRYFVCEGLKQIKNKFLVELFNAQEFSTKGEKSIITTAFYIVPPINATIRIGTQEEKEQLFRALLESDEEIFYSYRKTERWEHIAVNTARMIKNIKARQDRMRDKGVELIKERIEEKNLLDNKILIINVENMLDKNLTGLVANQLSRGYKRPVLMIRKQKDKKNELAGSARGYEKGAIKDFKQFLRDTGYFNYTEGHGNAFGVGIDVDKIVEANNSINELLKDVDIEVDTYEVDFEFTQKSMNSTVIAELYDYRYLWGGGVDEPLIAYKKIKINKKDIQLLGKNKSKTLKFKVKDTEFVKFFCNEEWFEETFVDDGDYVMNVIGKASINEWQGNKTPQIKIEDFEILEVKEEELIF